MENNLNASQKHAVQYWFIDGLAELSCGVIAILLALFFIILQLSPLAQATFPVIYLLIFVAAFGIRKLMMWLRQRTTYIKTGYIELRKGWEEGWLLGLAIAFTVLLLGFMAYITLRGIQIVMWMPAIGGVILALIFFLAGYRTKLVRFIYLAIFCLLLGFDLAISGVGDYLGTAVLCLITSLVLLAFGSITRVLYLRLVRLEEERLGER